jgi:hypothetical protein
MAGGGHGEMSPTISWSLTSATAMTCLPLLRATRTGLPFQSGIVSTAASAMAHTLPGRCQDNWRGRILKLRVDGE